jgi:large subunit ribosomal protein L18
MIQLVSSEPSGDLTHVYLNTKKIVDLGWLGSTNNLPASYLTGLAFGKKAIANGVSTDESLILDMGLQTKFYGGRVFAALKGAVDAGLNIAHSDVIFPKEERIKGEHIANYTVPEDDNRFSKYKIKITDLPKHFDEMKAKIEKITKF